MFNQMPYMMPYYNMASTAPVVNAASNTLSKASILGKVNWSSLLSNAQKTLNVVNQAIPLYYQVKPVFNNIKTLGKIGKELSKADTASQVVNTNNNEIKNDITNTSALENTNNNESFLPTFFL